MNDRFLGVASAVIIVLLAAVAYMYVARYRASEALPASQESRALSGTFECLSYRDPSAPHDDVCAFGLRTDAGEKYAVNFGQSAAMMELFRSGARVDAEGFIVPLEVLSTDHWDQYDIRGIFTITRLSTNGPTAAGKLDIRTVCESARTYMTFPDSTSADVFVAECVAGRHPEVIERYKSQIDRNAAI